MTGETLADGDPLPRPLIDAGVAWRSANLALRSRDAEFGGHREPGMEF